MSGDTLGGLVAEARTAFASAGTPDTALEARLIVCGLTGMDAASLISDPGRSVDDGTAGRVRDAIARRLRREPVYRILGRRSFHGIELILGPETLEPRADTETLVELALPFLKGKTAQGKQPRILDLGTGTGAIALALLAAVPQAQATATDIAVGALDVARENSRLLGLAGRFETRVANWFDGLDGEFDLIVSNPPYIRSGDIANLEPEVRLHDPLAALDGGPDGLAPYRVIASGAMKHLRPGGRLALEYGQGQRGDVAAILAAAGWRVEAHGDDLGGVGRATICSRME